MTLRLMLHVCTRRCTKCACLQKMGRQERGFGSYFPPFFGVVLSLRLVKGVERTRSGHAAFKTAFESWTYQLQMKSKSEKRRKLVPLFIICNWTLASSTT